MAEPSARRISPATVALAAAGLLALAAGAYKFLASDGTADGGADPHANVAGAGGAESVEAMAAGLEQRLREDPDDHQGWFRLGFAYRHMGRGADAERAFRRAAELAPGNADYLAYLGESLLINTGERAPPPEAEQLFRRVLELDPGNPQARYYLATLKDNAGDHRGAIDDLVALVRDAPPGATWEPQVREALAAIAAERGIDVSGRVPPPSPSVATAAIPGPTREQLEAARGIPPSEQDAMVRRMVDGLAARLRSNPRDADGWIRLMRSRMVLNDPGAAREALRSGLAAFAGDSATQSRLRAAARELGVPGSG